MFHSRPRRKRYSGDIIIDSQPLNWIKYHRSFASREWFESQVRYGEWIRERDKRNHFLIYTTIIQPVKSITILIKIRLFPTYVLVYHAHVLRKKK